MENKKEIEERQNSFMVTFILAGTFALGYSIGSLKYRNAIKESYVRGITDAFKSIGFTINI